MNEMSKLTGPEWDALESFADDTDDEMVVTALDKIEERFVSDHWRNCPECGGWVGEVMDEEETNVVCFDCGRSGRINTFGEKTTFTHFD